MSETILAIAFYAVAAVTVAAAIGVVAIGKIVYSALFLVLSFAGVAAVYILLSAEFVAAVQILIYAGAIMVLVLFAIMLTQGSQTAQGSPPNRQFVFALLLAGVLLASLVAILVQVPWPVISGPALSNTTQTVGVELFTTYLLPFEIAAVLLTAAMIGAILIARED
ncbi:MAG: NADH-quinone oxidoreductase subunit J [Chloroflexi bacterium]|nr:NADH-quinone oxidoreductase subunit J [Chloroflexota bacterium]